MAAEKKPGLFSFLFVPHYDELSLFSMSYSCALLFIVNNPPSKWNFEDISLQSDSWGVLLILLLFVSGMLLCLYHAFTDRKKTTVEKKVMMFFAAIINGFSAMWAGTHILVHSQGWGLSVFPIWNIISGYTLITLLRASDIEECIGDENVSLGEVLVGTIIITLIFLVCHYIFCLVWAITFSVCVAWATNMGRPVHTVLFRRMVKRQHV